MEAEYVACSAAVQEAIWLSRFLQQLEIIVDALDPVTIYYDSKAALAYAKDPKYHGEPNTFTYGITTLETCMVVQKKLVLKYISLSHKIANPLTKHIARDVFQAHVRSLGLCRM
jgi:hypothetical protein